MPTRTVTPTAPEKVEMIPLTAIVNKFDVRVVLDQDRVIQFAGLYQGGVKLPPVRLVRIDEDTYAYIDGRTRGAARAYLNLPDVPAVICNGSLRDNPFELFAEALESNWGGAKPPTQEDIVHTILRMLELGTTHKEIKYRLSFLPNGAITAYITWAKSVLLKRRISRALDSVAEGMPSDEAARTFKVKPDHLKNVITGKKGKWGARSQETQLIVEMKQYISRSLSKTNNGIGMKLSFLLKKVEEGEISGKAAIGVVKSYQEHLRKTAIRVEDWQARLTAISAEQDKAVLADLKE